MNVDEIIAKIDTNWEEHLNRFQRYVRQPSVSGSGLGVLEMAQLLEGDLKELGCQDVRVIKTPGWPVVYASLDVGAPKTMLLYGMYDVQPVVGEEWRVEPFSGDIVQDDEYGEVIVSRGICNQKGPLAAAMNVLSTIYKSEGTLPVNVKFVLEGEEELGSVSLPGVIEQLRSELEKCDFCYFPHFGQGNDGKVKQYLGTKGITHIKLTVKGGDWGAPTSRGIHGSNAIWIDNPIWKLVHILKTIKGEDEQVAIEGFYDDVAGPLEGDEEVLAELMRTFSPEEVLHENDVRKFKLGLEGPDLLRRYFFTPELNIDGIAGGFYDLGTKTLLPNEVMVNMDIRTVPNMEPAKIIELFKKHLEKIGADDICEVEFTNAYNWQRSKIGEEAVQALIKAERDDMGCEVEPWISLAGSAPFSLFQSMLGIPSAFGGLGTGGRVHSPNEFATVRGCKDMEKCIVHFLKNISADSQSPDKGKGGKI
ncbi:MAG: M20/M25/M40 family metallo-hydrolase [Eubacteriaceae bacterium]|jgi:acetylornithine deacetylase/succinyl-diaminopimelate desuccinylase-like protein|nr:M20/M25/M40 family metallo-hydrolase [Eubacteriaceae bacterium]